MTLLEPVPIEDEYCTGLARVEEIEGTACARFVLYARQTCYEAGSEVFVVRKKIILPYAAIPGGIDMATKFIAGRAISIAGSHLLRLVKG